MATVRIPAIRDMEAAIRIYYEKPLLFNKDIKELFGDISQVTVLKLKTAARDRMREKGIPDWNARAADTETAYQAWGLDIQDLEKRLYKLRKLGLLEAKEDKSSVSV